MLFIIEKTKEFDADIEQVYHDILRQKYIHEVMYEDISVFDAQFPENFKMKERISIGTIPFVKKFLKNIHGIDHMEPIEVPKVLRKKEYLGRYYHVVPAGDIPHTGTWFIKDASELKHFTYCGEMSLFFGSTDVEGEGELLDPKHKYILSSPVKILSEYRVFVSDDELKAIQYYNGFPDVMPSEKEIAKIKKMITNYQLDDTRPKSYSMDVAIIYDKYSQGNRDLVLIEIHPFACLGLYGFYSGNVPYMYANGFRWYLEHNTEVER